MILEVHVKWHAAMFHPCMSIPSMQLGHQVHACAHQSQLVKKITSGRVSPLAWKSNPGSEAVIYIPFHTATHGHSQQETETHLTSLFVFNHLTTVTNIEIQTQVLISRIYYIDQLFLWIPIITPCLKIFECAVLMIQRYFNLQGNMMLWHWLFSMKTMTQRH
jgi:hypothetical protein